MRLNFCLAMFFWSILVMCFSASPGGASERGFSLEHLSKSCNLMACGGSFIVLDDKRVVFFNYDQWQVMRSIQQKQRDHVDTTMTLYNCTDHKTHMIHIQIRLANGRLTINDVEVSPNELERLRLTDDWNRVLNQTWPKSCTITRLSRHQFLIAGGEIDSSKNIATIFDSNDLKSESVAGTVKFRRRHAACLLPDGNVLLVGGYAENISASNSAEIFDTSKRTFRLLPNHLSSPRSCATLYVDQGRTFVLGGITDYGADKPVSKTYEEFLMDDESFRLAGELSHARYFAPTFNATSRTGPIETVVASLEGGQFILCGGETLIEMAPDTASNAEILQFSRRKE